jgi:hypothetical protein
MMNHSALSVERVPASCCRRAKGRLVAGVLSLVGISLLAASASAGDITFLGASGTLFNYGSDTAYPSGDRTVIFSNQQSTSQLPANLSLSDSGSDGIVTVNASSAVSTSYTLSSSGNQMTADLTAMGQTSDTGAEVYQAQVGADTKTYFRFSTTAPTSLTYTFSGFADLIVPDPSDYDRYSYVEATLRGNQSFQFLESAPSRFRSADRSC